MTTLIVARGASPGGAVGIIPSVLVTATAADTTEALEFSIVAPAGRGMRLFVVFATAGANYPSSFPTLNGVALNAPTNLIEAGYGGPPYVDYKLHTAPIPAAGTYDLVGLLTNEGAGPIASIAVILGNTETVLAGGSDIEGMHEAWAYELESPGHMSALTLGSGCNDLILAFGVVNEVGLFTPDSPATIVDSIDLPGSAGTLFATIRPALCPDATTPSGFTFTAAVAAGEAVSVVGR